MYITNRNDCFPKTAIDDAIKHVQSVWPEEGCGIITDGVYVPFENKAEDRMNSFMINDPVFDKLYQEDKVECVIHSHESGKDTPVASTEDQQQQLALDIPCGIINQFNKAVNYVVFWGDQLPIEPILGRMFFYGVWDCYGLCRDYIRMNMGFNPPNTPREYVFWFKNKPFMENEMDDLPFIEIPKEDVEIDDFILYNIRGTKYINHCGIFKGDTVIHHLYGQISRPLPRMEFKNFARKVVRHNPEWSGYKE